MRHIFAYDPSNESSNFIIPGLQHKYRETVLLFVSEDCHSVCAWCFRKRMFKGQALDHDTVVDPAQALEYLRHHKEVRNVLLSGGDALLADPALLKELSDGIVKLPHIHSIRFGTRALVHVPDKYADALPLIKSKRVYVPVHIVRAEEVRAGLAEVTKRFATYQFLVQTPLLRGINDSPETLAHLFHRCAAAGLQPYYVFQCRPATGNERFALPLDEGYRIFAGAQAVCTGVVKTARYAMSNRTGKWEIVGRDGDQMVVRCHQGVNPAMVGTLRRAPGRAVWWDLADDDPLLKAPGLGHRRSAGAALLRPPRQITPGNGNRLGGGGFRDGFLK